MLQETTELQSLLNSLGARKALLSPEDKEKAMALVRKGADLRVCATTLDYKTLLHHLILTNKAGINDVELEELLQKKDVVHIRNGYGCSVLMSLIDQLQKAQCSPDDFKKIAMMLARHDANLSHYGTIEPYRSVMHHFVLTNKDGINDAEIVALLQKKKELVNVRDGHNQTPLVSLIDQLQNNQCSLESFKRTAMLLARHGTDLRVYGSVQPKKTLLHHLVLGNLDGVNNKEITELLQINPELMSTPDGQGHAPLHALLLNQPNVPVTTVERLVVLVGKKALSYTDEDGATLLHTACKAKNLEVAKYLFNQNLIISAKTKSKNTPLHSSVEHNDSHFWQWLYDNKIDINAQNEAGQTALHLAVEQNNRAMVHWLIKHNAFLYALDKNGKTALSIAEEKGYKEITSALLKEQEKPLGKLFSAINKVKNYGEFLKDQKAPKGQIAIDLAKELWSTAETFFNHNNQSTTDELPQFKQKFLSLLNSKNNEMSQYRTSWSTLIANVAIALTGIGALLMVGQLIHSKVTTGRALFFFQKPLTTSEKNLAEVETSTNSMLLTSSTNLMNY